MYVKYIVILFVVLLSFAGFVINTQYQRIQELETDRINIRDQLKATQENYSMTFQEKVELESSRDRIQDIATGSSTFATVKYIVGKPQKVAQSFSPNSSGPVNLVGFQLSSQYATGSKIVLTLSEFDGITVDPEQKLGKATVQVSDIERGKPVNFLFENEITITPEKNYMFIIEATDTDTDVDFEFTSTNTDNSGMMYEYSIRLGENNEIIDMNSSWRARETNDLKYTALIAQS